MLEGRLIRTEELLLRALALLGEEHIASLDCIQTASEKPDPRYWTDFPLDTPEDVRSWWASRSHGMATRSTVEGPEMSVVGATPAVSTGETTTRSSPQSYPRPSKQQLDYDVFW